MPDEFFSLTVFRYLFPIEALHLSTLAAEVRSIQTGVKVIFMNLNSRFFYVDDSQMKKGTDHFAEMAATTLFWVNLDSHSM